MQTINSLEKRLENLENAKEEEEKRTILFVDVEGRGENPEHSTSYIIDKCEAACDKETYDKALGAAFVEIGGKNPLESEDAISFIVITKEIAVKTVEKLRAAGIEVDIDVDGIKICKLPDKN
jgi:hypothetical protein